MQGLREALWPIETVDPMNGPIVGELGFNAGHDCFGPGTLANAVVGRAMGEDTMTGARIKRAARHLPDDGSTFAVTYGDGLANVDIAKLLDFHRSHGKLATLTGVRPPSRFGELEVDGGRVDAFSEKPQVGQGLISGGFFLFERGFLDYLSADEGCYLEREPLSKCAADGQLMVYEHAGYWSCMDTFRDWERLEGEWRSENAPWKVW